MPEFADTREYLVVHKALRVTLDRFVDATTRLEPAKLGDMLEPRWALFVRGLHHHHENEDSTFFPVIRRARPDSSELIDRLEREHQELVARLDAADQAVAALAAGPDEGTREATRNAIATVRDELVPHLDVEDAELLPAAAQSVPADEWKKMSEHAMRTVPKSDLPVVAGILDEVVRSLPKDEWPDPPPLIVRVLLTVSWRKRYAKFVAPLVA